MNVTDDILIKVALFRSKGRIPVVVWKHPINSSVLLRSRQ